MMFQNPIAWLGLAAIAVPILVHLLGRRRARRLPFPTLRFVPISPLPPVRRDRITDVALLIVRTLVIAAAAAALAQPLWLTSARTRDVERTLARAIVIDTSASMNGPSSAEPSLRSELRTAGNRGRREATALAAEATASRIIDAPVPGEAIAGALAWLDTQSGRTELIVVSDFQPGALERADLDRVPATTGIRLVGVPIEAAVATIEYNGAPPMLLTGAASRPRAEAALAAARQVSGKMSSRADRLLAIVFPDAANHATIVQSAQPIDRAWMFDAIAAIGRDTTLVDAAAMSVAASGPATPAMPNLTVVARAADGRPLVLAARGRIDESDRLLLFVETDAGSVTSAALISAAARATSTRPPASELDPAVRSADELRSWERPPAEGVRPATDPAGRSDGRWIWLAVLALLGLETWMRRSPAATAAPAHPIEEHERVA